MKIYYKILLLLVFLPLSNSFAQLNLSHEVGVSFGPVTMQTDYGERHHLPSSTATSFGVSVAHYLSFYSSNYNWRNGASYFSDHFKLKTDFSYYINTSLEHKGKWVEDNPNITSDDKLRAMKGSTKIINVGTQMEYYFKNLEDYGLLFNNDSKFAPYVSAGIQYSSFDPELTSDLGDYVLNPSLLPNQWQDIDNTIFVEKDNTFSLTFGLGTRYKMRGDFDFFIEARYQYFFSDRIDGLDIPTDTYDSNKFNDTLIYFSVGGIFHINSYNQ